MARNVGAAADPLDGPAKNRFAACVASAAESVGVVVEVATLGTRNDGHDPVLAMKFVTVPPPVDVPVNVHVVPEQEPAPDEKANVYAPGVPLIAVTADVSGVLQLVPSHR